MTELINNIISNMSTTPEVMLKDIEYIKKDIKEINEKLDNKYVSQETFSLTVESINNAISWIVKIAIFVLTPVYGAIIALLFKVFTS